MKYAYTPYCEELAHEFDPMTALVYGKVWRHCQDKEHMCRASTFKMAEELGLSRDTVSTRLGKLVEAGYLKRHTKADLKNRPHIYTTTGKISFGKPKGEQNKSQTHLDIRE